MEANITIALGSVVVGAGLGLLTQAYLFRLNVRRSAVDVVIRRYLDARDQICAVLAECTLDRDDMDRAWLREQRVNITRLYYQYYDYIPSEVIQALICFQACLRSRNNHLFQIRRNCIVRVDADHLEDLIAAVSLVSNLQLPLRVALEYASPKSARLIRVQLQARYTLVMINRYFTEKNLTSLRLLKARSGA